MDSGGSNGSISRARDRHVSSSRYTYVIFFFTRITLLTFIYKMDYVTTKKDANNGQQIPTTDNRCQRRKRQKLRTTTAQTRARDASPWYVFLLRFLPVLLFITTSTYGQEKKKVTTNSPVAHQHLDDERGFKWRCNPRCFSTA